MLLLNKYVDGLLLFSVECEPAVYFKIQEIKQILFI